VRGEFPFEVDEALTSDSPRVGDGVLLLDNTARVAYSSPNAVNAMHRMGIYTNAEGLRLGDLGIDDSVVSSAYEMRTPVTEEVERRSDVIVLMRCIPLLDSDEVTGALILMRDVTDLRRRDRLLLSKDAAIREVHHRVKNNLQTISSLLRLQARRLVAGEGRTALAEAERRIRSIALVHEILSREAGEQVDFNDIVPPLVRMAEDGLLTDRPVEFAVEGEAGELGADVATPLAVVITELLQNAAEHAFPDGAPGDATADTCRVTVNLANDGTNVTVIVSDNGLGLPPDFDVDRTGSLGLSIVRDLVQTQLAGVIEMTSDGGTRVRLQIPVRARPGSDPVRR
jgi:two-component sensor histidine kinase